MQTEALKTKIDITKLTADQVAEYEALYLAVYGADNIETEPSDAVGGIAAAGLTSEDFAEGGGKVTIEYATEWPATSSNARVRGSVKLLVNGKERKTLTAPVTMTVEIPDYFIASYSNASYNYEVEGDVYKRQPLVSYRDGAGDMTVAPDYTDGRGCDVYADRGKTDRFQDVYKKYQTMEGRCV